MKIKSACREESCDHCDVTHGSARYLVTLFSTLTLQDYCTVGLELVYK